MKKYAPEPESMTPKLVKFRPDQIEDVDKIHGNFSEFVRDGLDAWIKKNMEYANENSN